MGCAERGFRDAKSLRLSVAELNHRRMSYGSALSVWTRPIQQTLRKLSTIRRRPTNSRCVELSQPFRKLAVISRPVFKAFHRSPSGCKGLASRYHHDQANKPPSVLG